jgi:hypothetical protein
MNSENQVKAPNFQGCAPQASSEHVMGRSKAWNTQRCSRDRQVAKLSQRPGLMVNPSCDITHLTSQYPMGLATALSPGGPFTVMSGHIGQLTLLGQVLIF